MRQDKFKTISSSIKFSQFIFIDTISFEFFTEIRSRLHLHAQIKRPNPSLRGSLAEEEGNPLAFTYIIAHKHFICFGWSFDFGAQRIFLLKPCSRNAIVYSIEEEQDPLSHTARLSQL